MYAVGYIHSLALVVYCFHLCPSFQTGQLKARINRSSDDSLSCCSWQNSGSAVYCGGLKGHFYACVSVELMGERGQFQPVHVSEGVLLPCASHSAVDRGCRAALVGGSAGAGHCHTPRHQRGHCSRLTPSCALVQLSGAQSHTIVSATGRMG